MKSLNLTHNKNLFNRSFVTSEKKHVVEVRRFIRQVAQKLGFNRTDQIRIASAVSEVCRNMIEFAQKGEVLVKSVFFTTKRGLLIKIIDSGPGIPDIGKAMQDGYSTKQRMGLGLPGSKRFMDLLQVESKPEIGTKVLMCKWVKQAKKEN